MIFVIEYDRPMGRIIRFEKFDDFQRKSAQESRLKIELELNRKGLEHEVILLEADSETALRKSYRRYFENPRQLLKSAIEQLE